jgi:hypothetical protein
MNCSRFESSLIVYHYGTINLADRLALESHLLECPKCLKVYFALKTNLESANSIGLSDKARLRLRNDVYRQLHPKRSKWQGPFAFALAAGVVLFSNLVLHLITTSSATMPKHMLDEQTRVEK